MIEEYEEEEYELEYEIVGRYNLTGYAILKNKNGTTRHIKHFTGLQQWFEYNDQNKVSYTRDSNGFKRWFEYDEFNRLTHYKDSKGVEEYYSYDENGNRITRNNECLE